MAKGSKRRKKKSGASKHKGKFPFQDHDDSADLLAEEITALSAIFQDDFTVDSAKPLPHVSIVVRPYSVDNEVYSDNVAVELVVRCLPGYPHKIPKLQIKSHEGLLADDLEHLRSMLLEQANSNAREGRVMIYNLVEVTQEFLSEIVPVGQFREETPEALSSAAEQHYTPQSKLDEISGQSSFFTLEPQTYCNIDLFSDLSLEGGQSWDTNIEKGSVNPSYGKTAIVSQGLTNHLDEVKQKHMPHYAIQNPSKKELKMHKEPKSERSDRNTERNHDSRISEAEQESELLEEQSDCDASYLSPIAATASVGDILQKIHSRQIMERIGKHSKRVEHSTTFSVDDLKKDNLGRSLYSSEDDGAIQSTQKHLLMVHLLRLACSSKGPLPNVLLELVSQLQEIGVLPLWAKELANLRPQLFEKIFRCIFHPCNEGEPNPLITKFWKASPELLGESSNSAVANSRYLNDFEEIRVLGRGGFGHVVECINKLDGRHYAVKKIKLRDAELSINHKILREVATLSRVQHKHVIRYFQAWIESGVGSETATHDDISGSMQSLEMDTPEKNSSTNYLYIQMEYCRGTLREMLDKHMRVVDKELAWQLFRQIVEGLAHIHAVGIIHRDLTPNNILFDARNDIKIGDFGLAKFSNLEQLDRDSLVGGEISGSIDGTGQVGTYFYTAPEIEKGWPHIDEKVDMYSLGVVLFELWHPFSTAMERYVVLSELMQKGVFPIAWMKEYPEQAALVKRFIAQNPMDRPSASHVLRNELPPRMEDESLNDVLRTIQSSEDTYVFDRVISAIFDEDRIFAKSNYHSTRAKAVDSTNLAEMESTDFVIELVKEVFIQHGAHKFECKLLRFIDETYRKKSDAVKLLSSSGDMLELSHELRMQFAYWIATNKITSFKRYEISHVYRRGVGHSVPNPYLQGDFDIVGGAPMLMEAEVIKVAMDIVGRLFDCDAIKIHLNHALVLNAILTWAAVRREAQHEVLKLISLMCSSTPRSSIRKSKWALIRRQLLQGLHLPESTVDRLQIVERRYTGSVDEVLARLRGALPPDRFILSALEEISLLVSYLRVWKIETQVVMDTLMPPTEEYHKGIYFQVYLLKGIYHISSSEDVLLAIGGRYDWLLNQFGHNNLISGFPGAVGVSIALEKFCSVESCRPENNSSVLVCSKGGGGLLRERMELASELWDANIKAELVCASAPSLTEQYEYANENGIKWLAIITDAGLSHTGSIKVRHLEFKKEIEVPREEIVKFFSGSSRFKLFSHSKS